MKKKIILSILLLSIFMIGAVSASSDSSVVSSSKLTNSISPDSNNDNVDISNDENSEVKDTNNVLKKDNSKKVISKNNNLTKRDISASVKKANDVGSFNDLQTEIDNATESSVLNLTRDYNGAYGSRIQLDKDLTIDGQGHTLDCLGEGGCSAFYSNSGTITLKNLIIINGHNDYNNKGGAIHIEGSAQYTIINCTFNNNWAEDYGGAIYSAGDLTIINSTFKSNNVEDDDGGAIYCEKSVTLENCLFEKNHANVDGGAIYSKNNVNVSKNTRFIENEANGASSQCYGGAIRSEANVEVNNSTFTSNKAYDYGGAIYANTASIYSSTFSENKVDDNDGGAVYVESTIDVRDSSFYNNQGCVDGGAIFSKNNVNVKNTTFRSNKVESHKVAVEDYGGAIRAEGDVTINGSTFYNNQARFRGGAIESDGDVHINNTNFTSNNAYTDGGAIYCKKSVFIENSEFADNHAYVDGGAIFSKNNVNAKNTTFRNNKADDGSDDGQSESGGAILSKGDVKVDNCTFSGNYARDYGGAIYADTITWVDSPSYFKDNYVKVHDGGAIYTNKFATDVKYGVFINNEVKSDDDGGAIYINKENNVLFSQCYFENNRCGDEGGAIYLDSTSSTLYLEYNIFIDNWADTKGNIIYNKGKYNRIHNNWYGKNVFDFSNELVEYHFTGSESHTDDAPVTVELSLNETGQPTLIVGFISDGELFNYDAQFSADNGATLSNHKIGNNVVTSDIEFEDGITNVNATVNYQVLTLSYSFYKEDVTMNINVPEISFGDNATVTIIFTPDNATGTVGINSSDIEIGNISSDIVDGAATVIISNLSVGSHDLNVSYSGDGLYNPKEENVIITVNPKSLNINASAEPIHQGENATVIVTGLECATGNVNVTIDNNNWTGKINNATAVIIIEGLDENTTANVIYSGDANYTSAITTVDIIVNSVPKEDLSISASVDPIMVGDDAIVVVTGLENATGNVTVNIDGDKWYGEINNGNATIIVTGLTLDATATVFYAGDYRYNNATTTVDITVNPAIIVWYVNGNKESSGNGTTADTAFKTLKEALNKAPDDSTIYIASGTYTGENNTNLTINKNLTFVNYDAGEVIFDAQGVSRIWTVNAERINITGLTFKNGKEESACGAIFFNQTLNNSDINAIFIDNSVVDGLAGAIGFYADVTNTNINAILINNSVNNGYGGAIFFNGELNNVNITGNYTNNTADDYGGAILFYGDLNNVNITGNYTNNTAKEGGGAIFFNGELTDVNISGYYNNNRANDTAGVFLFNNNLTNVIISGDYSNNAAEYCAVYYVSEFTSINNSLITGNYYNNSANYCVVFLTEGTINNSNITGNYTNNYAKKGINIIGEANNLSMSGNYINNNISNGSVIYIVYCDENSNIHDSIFINNTMDDKLIIEVISGSVLSINNWFGNNASNYNIKPKVSENVTMANWLFLNATTNTTGELTINETSEITFKLYAYNSTSEEINEYDASKMNMQLELSQTHGSLDKTTALINETISYKYEEEGPAIVTGKFKTAIYTIVLAKQATEIINNKPEITINVTKSDTVNAVLNPLEAGNLTYTSSNTAVATVDETGEIIGLSQGTATITVSFEGNDYYAAAASKIIPVTVNLNHASVSVNNNTLDLIIDDTFPLVATTTPEGMDVTYVPDDSGVVSVDDNGVVTALKEGTATITVKVGDNTVYTENSTIVTVKVRKSTIITYNIINNTEGNVQINITVQDDVYKTPITDALINITGAINRTATAGVITDTTLTPGDYTINVEFAETDEYKSSATTIDFTVEIDKDAKIRELEEYITQLINTVNQLNNTIKQQENTINTLNNTIKQQENTINTLNNTIKQQDNTINTLNNTIKTLTTQNQNLTKQNTQLQANITQLQNTIKTLNDTIKQQNNTIKTLTKENQNLNNTIKNLNNTIKQQENTIKTLNDTIKQQNNTIKTLTKENQNLNNTIKQQENTIKTLNDTIKQQNNTIKTLTKENQNLNKTIQNLNNTNKQLQNTIIKQNNTIKELQEIIKQLNKTSTPTPTTTTVSKINGRVGSTIQLKATIKDNNTKAVTSGRVTFKVNGVTLKDEDGNTLYALVNNGTATLNYTVPRSWYKDNTTVEAVYAGNDKYASSRANNTKNNITPGNVKIKIAQLPTHENGDKIQFVITATDEKGQSITGGTVIIKANGVTLKDSNGKALQANVVNGVAIIDYNITLSAREYNLTAVYSYTGYNRIEATGKLNVTKGEAFIRYTPITTKTTTTRITANIVDKNKNNISGTVTVGIKLDGKMITTTTATNGIINVTIPTNITTGAHTIELIAGETGAYKSDRITSVLVKK
ncbi:Ig-like domain repeat protein [Methanosphaera sp. BMS]|uniref:Ig-like domain repeat protein n=1 Tax=Methanosphaera sp. BMS TaxID=1789762 RepID=UPI000DC1CBA5|nr:Ig-like domain repeat protein [Methanosphaera sp. BMS]AWX32008.1 hypothetical protein AW729_02365 [Methanosphaera sp. BMS]